MARPVPNDKGRLIQRVKFALKKVSPATGDIVVFIVKSDSSQEISALRNSIRDAKKAGYWPAAMLVWRDSLDVSTMSKAELKTLRDEIDMVLADG